MRGESGGSIGQFAQGSERVSNTARYMRASFLTPRAPSTDKQASSPVQHEHLLGYEIVLIGNLYHSPHSNLPVLELP